MKIGYTRVSTEDQNPDLQLAALKKVGCERIFIEKVTGSHVKRTELTCCLKTLAAGDILIVRKLDRLGRSLRDLIGLLDDLKARGVAFRPLTKATDTATPTGRAMWQIVEDTDGTGTLYRFKNARRRGGRQQLLVGKRWAVRLSSPYKRSPMQKR